jgi:rod shape determining protein RodA
MSRLNYRLLWDAAYVLYTVIVLLLLLVVLIGIVRLGAQRWLRFGGFNLQPSEFAKIIMVIFLARYFSSKSFYDSLLPAHYYRFNRAFLVPFIFMTIPAVLIVEQPDLGSGILVMAIFLCLVYSAGVRLKYLLFFFGVTFISLPFVWHYLRAYQKQRLLVFLNPDIDPLGAGYTVVQSKIAVGSGGLWGKGWLAGTQSQLHFLPEAHTDFIFATFAEQWGFLGCVLLLALYFMLIRYLLAVAHRSSDSFAKILTWGVCFSLALQIIINIAMNVGLAPVVGVPLPMMSYGGSSLLVTFISLGIVANIARRA